MHCESRYPEAAVVLTEPEESLCPEAYFNIEMVRASENTNAIDLMNLAAEELQKVESLPQFAIPTSINPTALVTAFLSLTPFAQMVLFTLFM